jgi:hypothetical protein
VEQDVQVFVTHRPNLFFLCPFHGISPADAASAGPASKASERSGVPADPRSAEYHERLN